MQLSIASPLAPPNGVSPRLALMEQVEPFLDRLGAATPPYAVLRFPELLELTAGDRGARTTQAGAIDCTHALEQAALRVAHALSRGEHDRLFVRLCALQGADHEHLSFAGVFPTSMPRRTTPVRVQVPQGLRAALAARFNPYADYYYGRHGVDNGRAADVMFSRCIDDAAMCGTAYVSGRTILAEYIDSPLAIALHDPVRFLSREAGADLTGTDAQIARCVAGLHELLHVPLDVEFIVTRRDRLYITEVRPLSAAHRRNWAAVSEETWRSVRAEGPRGNVVNTPGVRSGVTVDLRARAMVPGDLNAAMNSGAESGGAERGGTESGGAEDDGAVYIVNHRPVTGGTSSFEFLTQVHRRGLRDVAVIVDHGSARHDNHLQYAMFEDPGLSFCVHLSDAPAALPARVTVHSDGFRVRFA